MQYLYACHFSNGHIKVGRSSDPKSRIAQHEERVSCLGILLTESRIAECAGHVITSEATLVAICANESTGQHKNEWFVGLDFQDVCEWLEKSAALAFAPDDLTPRTGIQRAVDMFDRSPSKFASAVGNGVLRQNVEHWLRVGRVSVANCPEIAALTGISQQDLNDRMNWKLAAELTKLHEKSAA